MLHRLHAFRNQIGGWRQLRKEKHFALNTQTRGHHSVRPAKETVFSSLSPKRLIRSRGLTVSRVDECKLLIFLYSELVVFISRDPKCITRNESDIVPLKEDIAIGCDAGEREREKRNSQCQPVVPVLLVRHSPRCLFFEESQNTKNTADEGERQRDPVCPILPIRLLLCLDVGPQFLSSRRREVAMLVTVIRWERSPVLFSLCNWDVISTSLIQKLIGSEFIEHASLQV